MPDSSKMPTKPVVPADTKSQKTFAGPHGGGTTYNQLSVGNNFMVHDPISGHKQQQNVEVKKPK